jgi:hypothetical protein
MTALANPQPMATFDPTKPARFHEQLNDALYDWPGATVEEWRERASWHDGAGTVVNFDGLLFDGWSPPSG